MKDIVIDVMSSADLPEVEAIERKTFPEPWSIQSFRTMLESPYSLYLTARQNGKIVGYCGLFQSFEDADIQNVAVDEAYRNRGIAQAMLVRLMELGRMRGIRNFTLEVRISNAPAIRVYRKLGFTEEGRRRDFYSHPKEDAYIMWRRIPDGSSSGIEQGGGGYYD